MFKLDLEKTEEPEIKLPTTIGSLVKVREFWKTSVFIPIPKKGNVKECSN